MKTYNEMAESVLKRRDDYIKQRKGRNKKAIISLSCFCLALAVGVGVWQSGLLKKQPIQTVDDALYSGIKDVYGPDESESQNNASYSDTQSGSVPSGNESGSSLPNSSEGVTGDRLGVIIYNGKTYMQIMTIYKGKAVFQVKNANISEKDIVLDKKIGTGYDFDGSYNPEWLKSNGEKGHPVYVPETEVYTVKDRENLLCSKLDDETYIVLRSEE